MSGILTALQFLTIVRVSAKARAESRLASSMAYFPVIGLILGLLVAGLGYLCAAIGLGQPAISVIAIAALAVMTGGLHLDGLADTVDAFASGRPKDEMLRIMRDPHVGTMGVIALILVILLKIALLGTLSANAMTPALVIMCVLGRWAMVFSLSFFPYARSEGKARIFSEGKDPKYLIIATAITVAVAAAALGAKGLVLFAIAGLGAYTVSAGARKIFGGITGDTLGATDELVETLALFAVCVIEKVWL